MKSKKTEKQTQSKRKETTLSVLTGLSTGIANSLFGGGGGMIAVPVLVHLFKKDPKTAHATAILIILPLSIVSGLLYASFGDFNVRIGLPVLIGTVVGGAIGSILLSKLSSKIVMIIFSVVMCVAGVKMLFF